jgi:hypothetical protein
MQDLIFSYYRALEFTTEHTVRAEVIASIYFNLCDCGLETAGVSI